jgi:single-stranded-DNA-specific exonuclease
MLASEIPLERGHRYRWSVTRRAPYDELRPFGDLDPLLSHLLRNRGLASVVEAERFLDAERQPLADPFLMAGMASALDRLAAAIEADELIAVYGDYDVDGLTATAVLHRALRRLGARVLPFIPHRLKDGYGLQEGPLAELRAAGATLVVTVDCGVTAMREIALARSAGLEVLVTDHHLLAQGDEGSCLPPAVAVLNPNRPDCAYPFKELAGVGVAYKLSEGLLRTKLPATEAEVLLDDLLELVAIGTLADVVSLRAENRTMVRRGLRRLNQTDRQGLRALTTVAGLGPGSVDADRVCYALAPRLNAAGRLDHARVALDLLLTESPDEADALAQRLNVLNRARQEQTDEAVRRARDEVASRRIGPAIVISGPFPPGIAGLVAGRLAEEFNRPAIVLHKDGESCRGSARSVAGVNVVEAMRSGAEHLDRFGGHAMAAGLSMATERLPAFESAFQAAVEEVRGEVPIERLLPIDAELRALTASKWSTLELLPKLEPHGASNPAPVFLTRGLRVVDRRQVATDVTRLRLSAPGALLTAIVFGPCDAGIEAGETIDAVYRLKRNLWRGTIAAELELLDWRATNGAVRHGVPGDGQAPSELNI